MKSGVTCRARWVVVVTLCAALSGLVAFPVLAGGERVTIATAVSAPTTSDAGVDVYLGTYQFSLNKAAPASHLLSLTLTHYGTAAGGAITDVKVFQDGDADPGNGGTTQYGATVATLTGGSATFTDPEPSVINISSSTPVYAHVYATIDAAAAGSTVGFEVTSDTSVSWSQAYGDNTTYPVQLGVTTVQGANTPPVVTISSPSDAQTFNEGASVGFTGTATDAEDGDISASLNWTSNLDGAIGSGGSFSRSDLSPGTHTITASVTDSGGAGGTDQITLTINALPVVGITSPAAGSTFTQGASVGFTGTATDAEDGTLTASLTWTSSLDGTIGSGGSFSRADLSVGVHTITASVTDSGGATGEDQITLTINAPPVVTITAPPDSSSFNTGDSITFTGTATDAEDGTLTAGLTWTSDLDGAIGSGGSFSRSDLSAGTHVVTASVTDGDGATGQDQISITVTANNTPVVTISSPADSSSYTQGASISFTGTANDVEDGPLTAGLGWTSSLDGAIGTGGTFSRSDLAIGTHLITASVTDSGGSTGQDQVTITVDPPPQNDVTPQGASAAVGGCDQITVSAPYTGDDNGTSTTRFERGPSVSGPWTGVTGCLAVSGASPRQCVDVGVAPSTAYWYRVDFSDGDGVNTTVVADPETIGSYTTPACAAVDTTVGSVLAEAVSCNQIVVTAHFSGDEDGDGSATFEYTEAGQGAWAAACVVVGASPRQCTIPQLTPVTSYDLRVTLSDPDGVSPDVNLDATSEQVVPTPSAVSTGACGGDTSPPTVMTLAPARNGVVGAVATFKVQVYDADLSAVEWSVDSDSEVDLVAATLNTNYDCGLDCGVYEFAVDTTGLAAGAHFFALKATDGSGNVARVKRAFRVNNDGSRAAGDGFLLRRTRGSQLCVDCHNLKSHSSQATSTDYGNWAIDCETCHTPHGTTNIYLIREQIDTPNSGSRPVRFEALTGAVADSTVPGTASYANEDNSTGTDGPCQVCHTRTESSSGDARWRNAAAGGNADTHYTSAATGRCTDCHTHEAGFSGAGGACNSCHFAPPTVGKHGIHDEVALVPDDYGATIGNATATEYSFACAKCHSGSHFSDPSTPHTVEVVFDTTTAPANPGGSYVADPGTQTVDPGVNGDGWNWSDGTCSSLYCHSNAAPVGGTLEQATVTWDQDTGATPVTCTSCHDTRAATDAGGGSGDLSAAHGTHIRSEAGETSTYAFTCDECHAATLVNDAQQPGSLTRADLGNKSNHVNGSKDVIFSSTATASGLVDQSGGAYNDGTGTCAGTYCHSQGTSTTSFVPPHITTLAWDGGVSSCRSCHSGDATSAPTMATGYHGAHVNNAAVIGSNYECATCHSATVSPGDNETVTGFAEHVDGTKDVVGGRVGSYTPPTCDGAYCHSSGQAPAASGTSFENYTADWSTGPALDCRGCHGRHSENAFTSTAGEPNYTNDGPGTPDANSHQRHVGSAADCTKCHSATTSTGTAILAAGPHTDQTRDVVIAAAYDTGDPNYTAATKTCQNVACHGTGTPQWGQTLVCLDCHGGPDGGALGDGTPNGVGDEWATDGHGSAAGGSFTSALGGCDYCHQLDAGHTPTDTSNPYRVRFSATDNTLCLECHGGGPDGTADNGIGLNSDNVVLTTVDSGLDVDTAHFGTKHEGTEGGRLCWDCHDPHGVPSNILMVKSLVSKNADTYGVPGTTVTVNFTDNATPGQAVGRFTETTNTPRTGVCQACHDPAGQGSPAVPTNYWHSDGTNEAHNADKLCTDCHDHTNNFAGAGGDCLSCHANSGDAGTVGANTRRPVQADFGMNSHHVGASVDADGAALYAQPTMGGALTNYDCVVCHAEGRFDAVEGETAAVDGVHQNGVIDLRDTDEPDVGGAPVGYFSYDKDSIGGAVGTWMSGNAAWETQTVKLDRFCLSCHDADGAVASHNDGVAEGRGFTGSALNPFADSAIANEYDQQSRGRVVNIRNKVDAYVDDTNTAIPPTDRDAGGEPRGPDGRVDPTQGIYSRHAIRGDGSTWGAPSVYEADSNASCTGSGTPYACCTGAGAGTCEGIPSSRWVGSWNDNSLMGCADCHTTDGANGSDGSAHGANTEYLLKNADGTSVAVGTYTGTPATDTMNCYKCHTAGSYTEGVGHTGVSSDWVFTAGLTGTGRLGSNGNIYGLPCTNCHGGAPSVTGTGFGTIHGTSDEYPIQGWTCSNSGAYCDPNDTRACSRNPQLCTNTLTVRQAYRFMNGASLRYFDPQDWNAAAMTCYTLGASDGSFGGCTQHGPGAGRDYTRQVVRPIQY